MLQRSARALCALALVLSLQVSAAGEKKPAPKKDLGKDIAAVLSQPPLNRAHWGVDVVDLETGKALYSQNSDQLFLPASNTKLFTTAAALAVAGPDYRLRTTVEAEGKIDDNGRLLGDLVIFGRGDPNISGRTLPYTLKTQRTPPHTQILEEMADQVARNGLKIVDGDLIGDDTFYAFERYAEGWAWDDLQWIDGAPVSALTFNDNVVFVNVLPGEHPGDKAVITVEPETSYYELDNRVLTTAVGAAKRVGIHRDPGSKKIVLWGSLPLGDAGAKEPMSIEDPAEFVAQLFRTLLERRGITIRGKARARHGEGAQFFDQQVPHAPTAPAMGAAAAPLVNSPISPAMQPPPQVATDLNQASSNKILAEHVSTPLLDDIRVINKTSENLHAELALRLAGKLGGNGGSFESGVAAVKQFLLQAGLKDDEFTFLDGSGLSRRDLVTPAATVQLLIYAARQPWGPAFEESLPLSGVDGSLTDRFQKTPAAGLIHAKTGSLSHVNALSGYGQTQSGKRFVFSIFCNNHNLPGSKALAAIDAVMQLLVSDGGPPKK
ncbi:MAG TPA: D-alanyl-D-alanine carboxypeptidase/D-alanyl-D-alanine-endopeptidase [Candidatus Angelobacter sp.]|jgi:D-alanyl-D-alanine carboxypeptidase/D-alanyl-D-alanine-endopeptidase (penicillin-binding protein 4)|nr:D-alanyl-D-alanine carboxypeptidase/D-alanyl-D-alanine-endopeptidase [Candidatus Angelobacter sp.]